MTYNVVAKVNKKTHRLEVHLPKAAEKVRDEYNSLVDQFGAEVVKRVAQCGTDIPRAYKKAELLYLDICKFGSEAAQEEMPGLANGQKDSDEESES